MKGTHLFFIFKGSCSLGLKKSIFSLSHWETGPSHDDELGRFSRPHREQREEHACFLPR